MKKKNCLLTSMLADMWLDMDKDSVVCTLERLLIVGVCSFFSG